MECATSFQMLPHSMSLPNTNVTFPDLQESSSNSDESGPTTRPTSLVFMPKDWSKLWSLGLLSETQTIKSPLTDVVALTCNAFGDVYLPFESVKTQLIRQAREVFLCRFMGDYRRFLAEFLKPTATLLTDIRNKNQRALFEESGTRLQVCQSCYHSAWSCWPLTYWGKLSIQLCELDSALLKPGDGYFFVGPDVHIEFVLRDDAQRFDRSVMPGGASGLGRLQRLLLVLEKGIEKVDWTPLDTGPWNCGHNVDISVQTSPLEEDEEKPMEQMDGELEDDSVDPESISAITDLPLILSQAIYMLEGINDNCILVINSAIFPKDDDPFISLEIEKSFGYLNTFSPENQQWIVVVDGRNQEESHLQSILNILEVPLLRLEVEVVHVIPEKSENFFSFDSEKIIVKSIADCKGLQHYINQDQLPDQFGGNLNYSFCEWLQFHQTLDPLYIDIDHEIKRFSSLIEELNAPLSHQNSQENLEQLRQDVIIATQVDLAQHETSLKTLLESFSTKNQHYRICIEKTSALFEELKLAQIKLEELGNTRIQLLTSCQKALTVKQEIDKVLNWLGTCGEQTLQVHHKLSPGDSLQAVKEREEEFDKFYFLAMRQIERGNDLLEEVTMLSSKSPPQEVDMVADHLRNQLNQFSEKLEDNREKLEDTARCYYLLDKAYEWALESMRFVSQMKIDRTVIKEGVEDHIRLLKEYQENHPTISESHFAEMQELTIRLDNQRMKEQCKIAQNRCKETADLIQMRLSTLLKAKQQIKADNFNKKQLDTEEAISPMRATRSKSHPNNLWVGTNTAQSYLRRKSIPSTAYGCPVGSYTSFPTNYYANYKDNYELEQYMLQKEEQLLNRGLITEDLTTQGPVTSISKSVLQSRASRQSCSSNSSSSGSSSKSGFTGQFQPQASYRHSTKKFSRANPTWQMCEDALEKFTAKVKEQNEKLHSDRLLPTCSEVPTENGSSTEQENATPSPETVSKLQLGHTVSDPLQGPVPANSHLLTRTCSLDISDAQKQAKTKKMLLLIMKEMIQTERDYVKSLEYIIEHYIPELLREDIPQALRGQRNVLFGNLEKIFEFHSRYFLQELEQCEENPFAVGECFLNYESQFYLYALYNKNKPKCDSLMAEYGAAFFKQKQMSLKDKMDLASYLLKPVQRMGKYALLLKQLLKECPEREAEHQDLRAAEEMVRFQLRHGNDLLAMDALKDCDVNVKEQGQLLCQDEFLVWQGRGRKCLRHVFLFEDLILFSKARRNPYKQCQEYYQYKQSLKTTDLGLTERIGESPTKFEIWFRKRKVNDTYILQAQNPEVRTAWVKEISKLLWKQALRNREMRLAEMSSMGIGSKPCLDIKPSEDQINSRFINFPQLARGCRFRNSLNSSSPLRGKRPLSVISVSSSSSGSSQSSLTSYGTLNLGFEPGDSPRPLQRSLTQQSQCSTESGFCTDISVGGDVTIETETSSPEEKTDRRDSLLSNDSLNELGSPISQQAF